MYLYSREGVGVYEMDLRGKTVSCGHQQLNIRPFKCRCLINNRIV